MRMRSLAAFAVALALAAPARAEDPKYEYQDLTKPPTVDQVKPTVWKANMSLGLVWLAGNAQSLGFSGSALVGVKHYNNQVELSGGGAYVTTKTSRYGTGGPLTDEKTSAENWLIRGRYDRYFKEKNTVFASFQASGDKPAGYVYRIEPQVGYARLFFKSVHQLFRGELGYDYTYEHRPFGVDPRNIDYHSGRLFLFYENKFTAYATFSEGLELLEAFNHLDSFRLNSLTSLSSQIYKNISLKLNFTLMFNNAPPPRPSTLVDPVSMLPFIPPADDNHFDKVDTKLDLVLAVTFL